MDILEPQTGELNIQRAQAEFKNLTEDNVNRILYYLGFVFDCTNLLISLGLNFFFNVFNSFIQTYSLSWYFRLMIAIGISRLVYYLYYKKLKIILNNLGADFNLKGVTDYLKYFGFKDRGSQMTTVPETQIDQLLLQNRGIFEKILSKLGFFLTGLRALAISTFLQILVIMVISIISQK